ncbi:MAG: hypothetical protein HZA20_12280 [Nitrospirae bacterium]|nr:hypothetical protein [Nitrospirota bacterium]
MPINVSSVRNRLQDFDFTRLFIEELGWSPPSSSRPVSARAGSISYNRTPIAQLSGIGVFEITTPEDEIPDAKARVAIHKHVSENCYENLLIFLDDRRTQSLWFWGKREGSKIHPRDHLYVKGQPGDLFIGKLASMVVDISELDADGNITLTEVADRLKKALDIARVTKKFYAEFQEQHLAFLELIQGIRDERDRHWYASVLLNRLMFIYFLQRKLFLDNGDGHYLQNKLEQTRAACLICTTPEFDDLAKEAGLKSHKNGAVDPVERAKLRAELDGLIAHLYGLTEEEFAYILTTFPLVADSVKGAALDAYRAVAREGD